MGFLMRDNMDYLPIRDYTVSGAAVVKGQLVAKQDCYGFCMIDGAIGDEVVLVTKCERVLATKSTGTGNAIVSGDKLYQNTTNDEVSSTKGVGDIFVGWASEDASASATTVLMNFDGRLSADIS
jgi:predicted RecA/RadA family phage recombinase